MFMLAFVCLYNRYCLPSGIIMNTHILKLIIISCLLFQTACGITFKRKSNPPPEYSKTNSSLISVATNKEIQTTAQFNKIDLAIITSFYSSNENTIIRKDMIANTTLTSEQEQNLNVGEVIPRNIQIIPLPLKLENRLSVLQLNLIRVHAGNYVYLMNVKTRRILDRIKI